MPQRPVPAARRPVAIDLFAGAGGLSLGFEQAGFDIAAAVELDPIHAAVHRVNFPHSAVLCADISSLSGTELRRRAGLVDCDIDAVIGGPPCQGFSLIGHRAPDDPRTGLVRQFVRLVVELRPKLFVMENVPGIAIGDSALLLEEVIAALERGGFQVAPPSVLNAMHFGVPQDRRRLFLIGARRGIALPKLAAPSFRGRLTGGGPEPSVDRTRILCPSVSDAIGDLPSVVGIKALHTSDELEVRLVRGSQYARRLRGELEEPDDLSYPREGGGPALSGLKTTRHGREAVARFAATEPGCTEPVSRYFRLHVEGVSNTLRAGTPSDRGAFSAARPIHHAQARCLTVREAARLHSYPDWFRFHSTVWHGFRQVGNSVPPLLARAVASSLLPPLNAKPRRPAKRVSLGPAVDATLTMRQAASKFDVPATTIPPRARD